MQPLERYEIILYAPEWRDALARFLRHWWSSSASQNEAHFDWKYVRNPYFDDALMYLAVQGDRIVGLRGFIGSRWSVGDDGQPIIIPLAQDLFIKSEHRNTGLMQALTEFALSDLAGRGFPFVMNTTANEANFMYCWSTGWKFTDRIEVAQWPAPSNSNGSRMPSALQELDVVGNLRWIKRLLRGSSVVKGIRRQSIAKRLRQVASAAPEVRVLREPAHAEMVRLMNGRDGRRPIRHDRDEEYYRWRLDSPSAEHGFIVDRGDEPKGFILLTWNTPTAIPRLSAWAAASEETAGRLLAAAKSAGVGPIQTWTGTLSDMDREVIHAAGFCPISVSRFRPCILTKELTPRETWPSWLRDIDLSDLTNWDIDSLTAMA